MSASLRTPWSARLPWRRGGRSPCGFCPTASRVLREYPCQGRLQAQKLKFPQRVWISRKRSPTRSAVTFGWRWRRPMGCAQGRRNSSISAIAPSGTTPKNTAFRDGAPCEACFTLATRAVTDSALFYGQKRSTETVQPHFGGSKHPNKNGSITLSACVLDRYENRNDPYTYSHAWPSACPIFRRALAP